MHGPLPEQQFSYNHQKITSTPSKHRVSVTYQAAVTWTKADALLTVKYHEMNVKYGSLHSSLEHQIQKIKMLSSKKMNSPISDIRR